MLGDGKRVYAYSFSGYWKDVGTIDSLWEANMDLISSPPRFNLYDSSWRIYSRNPNMPPHYIGSSSKISTSLVTEGSEVLGDVTHSVIFSGVRIDEGAEVTDSVVMNRAVIGKGACICRAIIAENARIGDGAVVGSEQGDIAVVGEYAVIAPGQVVGPGEQVPPGATPAMRALTLTEEA